MTRYYGGQPTKAGFYLNRSTLELEPVAGGGGTLPGDKSVRYVKLPVSAVMMVGPLMGLVYVIFLPLVGILGIIALIAFRAGQSAQSLGHKTKRLSSGGKAA